MIPLLSSLRDIKPIKNFPSRKDWEAAAWRVIIEVLRKSKSKEDARALLAVLTSAPERQRIVLRAAAIARYLEGKSYRRIGEELWVSPQTMSAIKKGLTDRRYTSRWKRDSHRDRARKRMKNLRRIAEKDARDASIVPSHKTKFGTRYW